MNKGKIIGGIIGGVIGIIQAFVVSCVYDFISCGRSSGAGAGFINFIMFIVYVVVGIMSGAKSDAQAEAEEERRMKEAMVRAREEKEREQRQIEEQRRQRRAAEEARKKQEEARKKQEINNKIDKYNNWVRRIIATKNELLYAQDSLDTPIEEKIDKIFDELEQLKKVAENTKDFTDHKGKICSYMDQWKINEGNIYFELTEQFYNHAVGNYDHFERYEVSIVLQKLKKFFDNDYLNSAKNAFWDVNYFIMKSDGIYYINQNGYGECELQLSDSRRWDHLNLNAIKIMENINNSIEIIRSERKEENILFSLFAEHFKSDMIIDASELMWYYAVKKPFDVSMFEKAERLFNWFTTEDDKEGNVEVEALLASIYAKKQIGGEKTAQLEMDKLKKWLEYNSDSLFSSRKFEKLASGLAWMELYGMEREVLRHMVAKGVQLTAEMQERLSFLESGGKNNVKIYDIESSDEFLFDQSSIDWGNSEFNTFFRKLGMKNSMIHYSLGITKWNKTLPLVSGQKIDIDMIFTELQKLTEDFDGDVSCQRVKAKAVDLDNMEFDNAALFSFDGQKKRNICVSVLFHAEKYGRNLNLTFITLFTPDSKYNLDELQKYATAIKGNIYMDSFRESVLQVIDDVVKEKRSIYDD